MGLIFSTLTNKIKSKSGFFFLKKRTYIELKNILLFQYKTSKRPMSTAKNNNY